jgi:hypothetical protein
VGHPLPPRSASRLSSWICVAAGFCAAPSPFRCGRKPGRCFVIWPSGRACWSARTTCWARSGRRCGHRVLSKSIGELRAALGDSFKAPRLIETVQRRLLRGPRHGATAARGAIREGARRRAAARLRHRSGRHWQNRVGGGFLDSAAVREVGAPVWIARGVCVEQHGSMKHTCRSRGAGALARRRPSICR